MAPEAEPPTLNPSSGVDLRVESSSPGMGPTMGVGAEGINCSFCLRECTSSAFWNSQNVYRGEAKWRLVPGGLGAPGFRPQGALSGYLQKKVAATS